MAATLGSRTGEVWTDTPGQGRYGQTLLGKSSTYAYGIYGICAYIRVYGKLVYGMAQP